MALIFYFLGWGVGVANKHEYCFLILFELQVCQCHFLLKPLILMLSDPAAQSAVEHCLHMTASIFSFLFSFFFFFLFGILKSWTKHLHIITPAKMLNMCAEAEQHYYSFGVVLMATCQMIIDTNIQIASCSAVVSHEFIQAFCWK